MAVDKEKIMADAERLARDIMNYHDDDNREGESSRRRQFTEQADRLKSKAQHGWMHARKRGRQYGYKVNEAAQENVWMTAGIAAAAGALLGILAGKKKGQRCNCDHC